MNRLARSLAALAGLTAALVAAPARADHDRCEDGRCFQPPPPPLAGPAVHPAPPAAWAPAPDQPAWAPAPAPVMRPGWRAAELRQAYRELDLRRARFYARWDGNPRRRDRFEAWYAGERAELDRAWYALWRPHERWDRRGARDEHRRWDRG